MFKDAVIKDQIRNTLRRTPAKTFKAFLLLWLHCDSKGGSATMTASEMYKLYHMDASSYSDGLRLGQESGMFARSRKGHKTFIQLTDGEIRPVEAEPVVADVKEAKVSGMIDHFCSLTMIERPVISRNGYAGFTKLWATPLRDILRRCNGNDAAAKYIISDAVEYMEENELTISSPSSIHKVSINLISRYKKRNRKQ